ncbi:MAG: DNA polymerase III subunit delta [Desulfovibrio sp.]|jgi:DNA polymerase-3 subunit delta|nr:DNA polymerase III subunit delta [Desulfovibrio sp.]
MMKREDPVRAGSPAFLVCLCPDSRLLQNRLDHLLAAHGPGGGGAWRRFVFWGDEGLPPAFWEHMTLQGLFAQPKAVVLRRAEVLPVGVLEEQLSPVLTAAAAPDGRTRRPLVLPVICLECGFEKGKAKVPAHVQRLPFYTAAQNFGFMDITPPLYESGLAAYIKDEAAGRDIRLKADELSRLAASLPPDAALIGTELEKLALLRTADGRLPEDAVNAVGTARELSIFEMIRIVQQHKRAPELWKRILEDKLSGETSVFGFIALLLREARLLWQILMGPQPDLPPQAAAQKKLAARSLGPGGTAQLWDIALQAEKGIKSGERSPEQAFEMLAANLFMLFTHMNQRGPL